MAKAYRTLPTMVLLVLTILFLGGQAAFPDPARAQQSLKPVEGAAFNVTLSLADNLKPFIGRRIYLTLDSGTRMVGVVKEVGKGFVHLEKLEGREYFDALVRIDSISAVEARFWQP